ncbi:hypothetical protein EON64_00515 [archaeon]|nr:MAG: hypothetical protein EON64_00515 [archaeon]
MEVCKSISAVLSRGRCVSDAASDRMCASTAMFKLIEMLIATGEGKFTDVSSPTLVVFNEAIIKNKLQLDYLLYSLGNMHRASPDDDKTILKRLFYAAKMTNDYMSYNMQSAGGADTTEKALWQTWRRVLGKLLFIS